MKIDIITLHTINNYGSVLQTYATQHILEEMGHTAEIIDYWRKNATIDACVDELLKNALLKKYEKIWNCCGIFRSIVRILLRAKVIRSRNSVQKFLDEYVHLTPKQYTSFEELQAHPPQADVYLTGSDQVWNSIWNNGFDPAYYLEFVPEDKKRIAFSASIGREELDAWEIEPMKQALKKYSAISMREDSGVKILNELGIKAEMTLDPTLMLTGDQWRMLAHKPKCAKKPYVLVYQLNANPEMDQYVEKFAKKFGLDILRLAYGNSEKKKAGTCLLRPRVEEFLGAFANAECVVTDSFHATSFALNFGVQFISIAPPRFSTRLTSILKKTHTEDRMLQDYNDFEIYEKPIHWDQVQEILKTDRDRSMAFLRGALNE